MIERQLLEEFYAIQGRYDGGVDYTWRLALYNLYVLRNRAQQALMLCRSRSASQLLTYVFRQIDTELHRVNDLCGGIDV